jgi:hypothetical protein
VLLARTAAHLAALLAVFITVKIAIQTAAHMWPHTSLSRLQVKLDPRFVSGDTPPLSCRAFLLRLLNNLKQVYITLNMAEEALAIVRYAHLQRAAGMLTCLCGGCCGCFSSVICCITCCHGCQPPGWCSSCVFSEGQCI